MYITLSETFQRVNIEGLSRPYQAEELPRVKVNARFKIVKSYLSLFYDFI